MKKLLTNSKSNFARNLGLALVLIVPIICATSCKKEESPCTDYTNPDCENYDPARVRTEQLRADSAALTGKFRQNFNAIKAEPILNTDFTPRFNILLDGNNTLKDSVNATDLSIDAMHNDYGNPMAGATTEQNAIVDSTKQTCVNWFDIYTQLGHTRD